jgi:hypothetical protein
VALREVRNLIHADAGVGGTGLRSNGRIQDGSDGDRDQTKAVASRADRDKTKVSPPRSASH